MCQLAGASYVLSPPPSSRGFDSFDGTKIMYVVCDLYILSGTA